MMTPGRLAAAVALVAAAATAGVRASDRTSVYAKVDRVVFAPSADAPSTVQVFGVFSIAVSNNPNDYRPPARGYLYFALPSNAETARREWNDLKSVAGTGQIVSFGIRYEGIPRLRDANEPPASPDVYTLNYGVNKVRPTTDYAPVKLLVDFNR